MHGTQTHVFRLQVQNQNICGGQQVSSARCWYTRQKVQPLLHKDSRGWAPWHRIPFQIKHPGGSVGGTGAQGLWPMNRQKDLDQDGSQESQEHGAAERAPAHGLWATEEAQPYASPSAGHRQPRPAGSDIQKSLNAYGQAFQACPKGREGSGYIPSYSPRDRHLASIRVLKKASGARATGPQGILGVVVSVGNVALVADRRRGGRMGGSLWPAFVTASWVAKGAQTTQSLPSRF